MATDTWDEAIAEIRREIDLITEPVRTAAFQELDQRLEYLPEGWKDGTKDEIIGRFLDELPLSVECICDLGNAQTLKEAAEEIHSLALEVRALKQGASKALNPSFDECACAWGRKVWEDELARESSRETDGNPPFSYHSIVSGERLHDTLLALNGPNPLAAMNELLIHIHDEPIPRDLDIADVFAQHNWRDPIVMHDLAKELDRVWESVIEQERRLERTHS